MNAAVYLRVSTAKCRCGHDVDRHADGGTGRCAHHGQRCHCERCEPVQSEGNQEPECLRVCASRGWHPVLFPEKESAVKHRPEWDKVRTAVHRGEVGAVVVWALDRIGRNRVQVSSDVAEIMRKAPSGLVSVREPWTDQPMGRVRDLLIEQYGWFAESERERLIERTKAGQARAWAAGKRRGRPPLPAEDCRRIEAEFHRGTSAYLAARQLDIPESTVRKVYKRARARSAFNPCPHKVSPAGGAENGGKQGASST